MDCHEKTRLLRIEEPFEYGGIQARAGVPPLEAAVLRRHSPDAHWVVLDEDNLVVGRCSLWWKSTPAHLGQRTGFIGHYAADDDQAGRLLLERAEAELRANDCALAVGPMDGNTWRNYRFATGGSDAAPFFLEPVNAPEWPRQFITSGFSALAGYASAVDEDLHAHDEQSALAALRMEKLGVSLQPLQTERFEEELKTIYQIVRASFHSGFLYQPVAEDEFISQYQAIRHHVLPPLVIIARHQGQPAGFIFTVPDLLQARDGKTVDTAIIKTLAVMPDRQFAGLGSHLVAKCRQAARELGFRRLIHALMHDSNHSQRIRKDQTSIIRRYTLFSKPL